MCQYIIVLVERKGWRYITQCEHGTVHLVWDNIGVHLPAQQFIQLALRIVETNAEFQQYGAPPEHRHCRLQVGRACLTLPLDDFTALAELVEEALPQVNLLEDSHCRAVPRLALPWRQSQPLPN
jgi:hypothetical protein